MIQRLSMVQCLKWLQYLSTQSWMQQQRKSWTQGAKGSFRSLVDQVVLVGLDKDCRLRADSHQLRWITSLQIMGRRQWQSQQSSQPHVKCLDIGNDLFLKLLFCEQQKTPVTKIKSCSRTALNQDQLLPFPAGVPSDEGLLIERGGMQGRRIIEDLEMVEVSGDRELQLPEEQSYEVVRLPLACQTVPEENSSNEQLIEKTRYLLVRTLDLDDQTALTQSFQPSVTLNHSFRGPLLRDCSNIPDFCFPEGVQLVGEVIGCGYQVLTFILTQQDNSRVYANCLRFKEKLSAEIVHSLPPNCVDRHLHGRTLLFADRAFCLLSRYAHTQFLHALLEELFRHYLTLHNAHALRYRHQVKSDPCIPLPAHPPAFDVLAAEFIKNYEKGLACAERELGQAQFMKQDIKMEMEWFGRIVPFPEAVEDAASLFSPRAVHCLFSVLQVQRIAQVFLALLQEQKVFFVSDSQIVLGYVIQALLSFLYPLRWEHVILPILPQKLLQLLQAPVPLIAGIPTALASDNLICSAKDATVVFLDCNQVIWRERGVEVKEVNHLRQAVKKLRSYQIYSKDHVLQMLLLKEQFFLFRIHEKQCQHLFSAEHIKHIFFETMLLFLQNYNAFYRAPTHLAPVKTCPAPTSPKRSEPSRQSEPPRNEFNFKRDYLIEEFVKAHPKSLQKFMRKFTQCTHFINFIYRYASSSTASHKALIDRALITQRNSTSPLKLPAFRLSQQPPKNSQQINNLRKKVSLQPQHNTTWSPPPKKSEEISTNYSRNLGRYSMKLEDVEIAPDREPSLSQDKKTRGGQICEAITKALTNASHTKRNVIIWTQARVARLKRIFAPRHDKQTEEDKQQGKDEKVQKQEGMQKESKDQ